MSLSRWHRRVHPRARKSRSMTEQQTSPQEQRVLAKFDEQSADYASWYDGPGFGAHAFRRRRDRTLEVLQSTPAGKVLDIGCGPGVMVSELLDLGHEVWGVDVAPGMIEQCQTRFGSEPRAHFSLGKIEQLDFPDGFFDAVTCLGVVEYLDEDEPAVREMHRVLRSGGIAIVTCPHYWAPWRRWDALYWAVVQPIRSLLGRAPYSNIVHREYREPETHALFEANGFEVVDVCYYGFGLVPTPFDRRLPRLQAKLGVALDEQARGPLRKLGMGFNMTVRKR